MSSSPASRLYVDCVHSIFAFAGLREVACALRCCSGWRAAACSYRGTRHRNPKSPPLHLQLRALAPCCVSPLGRLISSLALPLCGPALTIDSVALLRLLPSLTAAELTLDALSLQALVPKHVVERWTSDPLALALIAGRWPDRLTSLTLTMREAGSRSFAPYGRMMLASLCRNMPVLHTLRLRNLDYDCSLRPLVMLLPHLTSLEFAVDLWYNYPSEAFRVVRELHSLRYISLGRVMEARYLGDFLRSGLGPHRLQHVQELDLRGAVIDEQWQSLLSLPALTRLAPAAIRYSELGMLSRFPQLATLDLTLDRAPPNHPYYACVIPTLVECVALTSVTLRCGCMRKGDLADFASRMAPRLLSLALDQFVIESLAGLSGLFRLHRLQLVHCLGVKRDAFVNELQFASELRTLQVHFPRAEVRGAAELLRLRMPQLTSIVVAPSLGED